MVIALLVLEMIEVSIRSVDCECFFTTCGGVAMKVSSVVYGGRKWLVEGKSRVCEIDE